MWCIESFGPATRLDLLLTSSKQSTQLPTRIAPKTYVFSKAWVFCYLSLPVSTGFSCPNTFDSSIYLVMSTQFCAHRSTVYNAIIHMYLGQQPYRDDNKCDPFQGRDQLADQRFIPSHENDKMIGRYI